MSILSIILSILSIILCIYSGATCRGTVRGRRPAWRRWRRTWRATSGKSVSNRVMARGQTCKRCLTMFVLQQTVGPRPAASVPRRRGWTTRQQRRRSRRGGWSRRPPASTRRPPGWSARPGPCPAGDLASSTSDICSIIHTNYCYQITSCLPCTTTKAKQNSVPTFQIS